FLDFQVNVCPGQAGRIKAIEVTGRMTGNPSRIRLWKAGRPSDRWPDKRRPLVANTVTDVTRLCEKAVLATSRPQMGSVRVARDPTEGTLAGRGIGERNRRQVPTP